jgi:hypothetical protein
LQAIETHQRWLQCMHAQSRETEEKKKDPGAAQL